MYNKVIKGHQSNKDDGYVFVSRNVSGVKARNMDVKATRFTENGSDGITRSVGNPFR